MTARITTLIMPPQRLLRFRWSDRHKAATHCNYCRARLWLEIPTADQKVTDATCSLCSRIAYELVYDGLPAPMTAEQFAALPTKQGTRAPWKPGPKPIYVDAPARQRAYRLRVATGQVQRKRWAVNWDACIVCGSTEYTHNARGRCMKCRDRSQEREIANARRTGR